MKEILCFGDSNTYGLIPGMLSNYARYDEHTRWTGLLQEKLNIYGYRIIEEGLCGRTTIFDDATRQGRNGAQVLPMLLESHQPLEWVVLMLGTNDCKSYYGASAKEIGDGLETLVQQVRAKDEQINILLISPIHLGERVYEEQFDPEFDVASIAVSKELKQVYQEIAKRNHCEFLAASDYAEPSLADMEHLTPQGHENLAEAVYDTITSCYRKNFKIA